MLSQDFAGLGGDVRYLRTRARRDQILGALPLNFIFSIHGEGGYIHSFRRRRRPGSDPVRLTDRFFGPQMRGFDIRGIGPRVQRTPYM